MSRPCEFEFVPTKRDVRDSAVQIRNHHSKSEVLIQSETALNAGERGSFDGSIGSNTSKRTQRCTVLLDTRTSSRQVTVSRRKRFAQILEGCQSLLSVLQCFSNCKMGILQGHGSRTPATRRRMTNAYDGSGEKGLQARYECREPRYMCVQKPRCRTQRDTPMHIRRHQHRNRNRQLSMLIVNIETDAQTE